MSGDQEDSMEQLREEKARAEEAKEKAEEREKNLEDELRKVREKLDDELRQTKEKLEEEMKKSAAKDIELRKLSGGGVPKGSIKLEVEVEKVGEDDIIYSPYSSIGGASFRLGCREETENEDQWIAMYLNCNDNAASKTYSDYVEFTLKLTSPWSSQSENFYVCFMPSHLSHRWLARDLYRRDEMVEICEEDTPARVEKNCYTLEAHIKMIAYYKNASIDFASPDPDLSDVILLVGEREFNVNRILLAHFCGYFKVLFCSNFAEKNKKEIELKDIDAEEFQEMLDIIYPQRKKVTAATVKGLLRMADFFDCHVVRVECVEFLFASPDFTTVVKLELSEEFRLSELQYRLVESLKKANDVKAVINSADFGKLSVTLKNSLLEKHFKLLG